MPETEGGAMCFLPALLLSLQMVGGAMAVCNEACHDGEVWSDSAEMCAPKEPPAT